MKKLHKAEPYFWILPSCILMAVFIVLPIFYVLKISLSRVSEDGTVNGFTGFANFSKALSDSTFWMALGNTLIWIVAVVGISTVLGIILAMILNNRFHGKKIVRAIMVIPWATSLVIQANAWNFMIAGDQGALNTLLLKLGIIKEAINRTPTADTYLFWEIACCIFVAVPFVTLLVLAGLQNINDSVYEAATLDGAGSLSKFFHMTLPLLKRSIAVSVVLNILYVFNSFPITWTISMGGPENHTDTLVTYLYKLAFCDGRQGEAAAVSVIGFLILLACAIICMISMSRKVRK